MRRLVPVFCLAMLAVCLAPVPAHAYFWEWLDSLSGPRFGGGILELQLRCEVKSVASSESALKEIEANIQDDARIVARAIGFGDKARPFVLSSASYLVEAKKNIDAAIGELDNAKREGRAPKDVTSAVLDALAWQARAAEHFDWADRLQNNRILDPRKKPGDYDVHAEPVQVTTRMLPVAGVRYSLCRYKALERDTHYLSGLVGFGLDIKNDDEHSRGRHKMLTTGLTYNKVVTPWLTIGAGGGVATFFTSGSGVFAKAYVHPLIVDVKPGAFVPRANVRSPWRHFVYLRYSLLTFPGGFDSGDFTPNSPKYPTELVHQVGIHFDLTPVRRGKRGNW